MLAINSTNVIQIVLSDDITGDSINTATVSAVISDANGATVATIPMSYVAASSGVYRGLVPADTGFVLDHPYTVAITSLASGNQLYAVSPEIGEYA